MSWPTDGTDGWEDFGTLVDGLPVSIPLPEVDRTLYYDPSPLGGVGRVLDQGVLTFGASTVVARGRATSVEVEFLQPEVYGVHLLDWLVWDPSEPCALTLDLYDDDRTTIRWSAGTSAIHPNPYLVDPENYAEQEVDVAAGAATLGTVTVTLVDRFRIAGDQDSGWMTDLLTNSGISDIRGRRARLRRFISEELGYVVLADGPAGTPRLESDYASFSFEIRDTRETERKVRIFDGGGGIAPAEPGAPFDPTGVKTLLPDAVWGGYGYDLATDTYLIDPALPLQGEADIGQVLGADNNPGMRSVNLVSNPGNTTAQRDITLAAYRAGQGVVEILNDWYLYGGIQRRDYRVTFPYLTLLWREVGTIPWNEITGTLWIDGFQEDDGVSVLPIFDNVFLGGPSGSLYRVATLIFGDSRGEDFLPPEGMDLDFVVVYRGPPSQDLPVYVDGITAGEFARNVYAGLYSARNPDGTLAPTGIRYNEDDLLQITDLVRRRFFEVITDARDWLEQYIYAPTGWAPALNDLGEISPVSQVAPTSLLGLTEINNAIAEPSPDWNAGERVINVIRFIYPREYKVPIPVDPTDLWPPKSMPLKDQETISGDQIFSREVIVEYIDVISVDRNGRQVLEIKGDAFAAIGDEDGEPVGGDATVEQGAVLAGLRQLHLGNRYAFGSPAVSVAVMRLSTIDLRAGSWVTVDLTWFPDLHTGRRGLVALAQVVALSDLDCAWRRALLEIVTPLTEPGS